MSRGGRPTCELRRARAACAPPPFPDSAFPFRVSSFGPLRPGNCRISLPTADNSASGYHK
eukprot:4447691-Prymnesium_polylepis.1